MNIIERAPGFLHSLRELAGRTAWEWRRCPFCGETLTGQWGSDVRHPWTLAGRQTVRVPRHRCERCQRTYCEESPWLVRGSWYAREVHSDTRLERAALVWAISHNFAPAQGRCERKRQYRHPGQCPLAVAGVPPGNVSYLDALGI